VNGKVAVITGSSSGFGLLTTVELASRGYRVVATMRDLARRARLDDAAKVAGLSEKIDVRCLDISRTEPVAAAVEGIVRDYGRIDVLINNAGFAMAGFAEDIALPELRDQFETNFFGHVAVTKAVLPAMRAQKSGHIIMVSSISGRTAQPTISSYSASKFALEGWSESLRIETRSMGIKVVLIEPGAYATDIWTRNSKIGRRMFDGTSPNAERGRKFRDHVQSGGIKKRDPREVAKLIARVAEDPNPTLRYVAGTDAHLQLWLKRLAPWSWYERIVARAAKID
jgi:NAD(P)-dependent dehydrogenase (short-subunit alcohol dehydrogenase family)